MLFYQSVIQSVIAFSCTAWAIGLSVGNQNKINRITRSASKIIGIPVKDLGSIYEAALVSKLESVQVDDTHPLHRRFVFNKSGRLRQLKSNTYRHRLSFLPSELLILTKIVLDDLIRTLSSHPHPSFSPFPSPFPFQVILGLFSVLMYILIQVYFKTIYLCHVIFLLYCCCFLISTVHVCFCAIFNNCILMCESRK